MEERCRGRFPDLCSPVEEYWFVETVFHGEYSISVNLKDNPYFPTPSASFRYSSEYHELPGLAL